MGPGLFVAAGIHENHADVVSDAGADCGQIPIDFQGFDHVGAGFREITALRIGHAHIVIKVLVVRGNAQGFLILCQSVPPAALLAQAAGRYKSEVWISKAGMQVNAKSIMGIMMIAAEQGAVLTLSIEGPDEQEALAALKAVLLQIFEEEVERR